MGSLIQESRNHFSFMKGGPNSPSQMYKAYIRLKLSRKESEKCIMLPANELSATHKGVFLLLPFIFQVYGLWNITYCKAEPDVVKRLKMGMQRIYTASWACPFFLSFCSFKWPRTALNSQVHCTDSLYSTAIAEVCFYK